MDDARGQVQASTALRPREQLRLRRFARRHRDGPGIGQVGVGCGLQIAVRFIEPEQDQRPCMSVVLR